MFVLLITRYIVSSADVQRMLRIKPKGKKREEFLMELCHSWIDNETLFRVFCRPAQYFSCNGDQHQISPSNVNA